MSTIDDLARQLLESSRDRRWIQGIAGIPGSGKSTLAAALLERLPGAGAGVGPGAAVVVPMDGFHLPNQTLIEMGRRDYKGAPDTFDAVAYIDLLRRLKNASEPVQIPIYDRNLHEPVPGSTIDPSVRIIITEGNYLLLDQPPWSELADVLDSCWYVDTPIEQARQWAVERHIAGGRDPDGARRHYERNDLPNARFVLNNRRAPDSVIRSDWH